MDTTNLRQIEGGTVIKQADRSSVLSFILQDAKGREKKLDGQSAQVALYTNHGKFWETTTTVKGAEVSFSLPGNLAVDDYLLDISVAGYVFPSDRDLIIRVTQGFNNLPDKETAEQSKRTLEEITADVQKQADEKLKQNIEIITKKKDTFSSYVDTKATEVSSTGDKYLKDIEAAKTQNINTIKQVSKTEADKITASSTEAIRLIGEKKDQTLQEIDSKSKALGESVKADVEELLKHKVDKEANKTLTDNNFSTDYKNKLNNLDKEIDSKVKTIADTIKTDVTSLLKDKVDKEPGKTLTDNNFSGAYKYKLDNLDKDIDKKLEPKADKTKVDDELQKLKDLIFDIEEKHHPPKIMTAIIDQSNSNPLTCITYEDDAKMMEKGSPEWDDFFKSQLVLFKDGKEVRELEDSELSGLKPEDGDVMVRFPRKGLRIKTAGEKVYVSMTSSYNSPKFKYYAHSRGDSPRDNFYLGAYLGFEESGKLRSITGKAPTGSKTIGDFRTIAQANGTGYEQLAFYQWTFLQAMYVLKYGNLNSQTALGKGNTYGSNYNKITGETNGKGIDFGTTSDTTKVRFQWVEDFFGTKSVGCDGWLSGGNSNVLTSTDNFNDDGINYSSHDIGFSGNLYKFAKKVQGTSELGFLIKSNGASETTYFCDYQDIYANSKRITHVGGHSNNSARAGAFAFYANASKQASNSGFGARLMFL